MNHGSNTTATPDRPDPPDDGRADGALAAVVDGLWYGRRGRTVRCVPWRRTLLVADADGPCYAKLYTGRTRQARAEWRWLHRLDELGVPVCRPLASRFAGRRALVVTAPAPGRSLDAWAVDAQREGWLGPLFAYACRALAPLVGRLHGHGLVYRDLNCAHVFCRDPRTAAGSPVLIDAERVLRPRFRWRRWVVKDLATLLASVPVDVPRAVAARFLRRAGAAETPAARRALGVEILRKAARVRAHRPRYG